MSSFMFLLTLLAMLYPSPILASPRTCHTTTCWLLMWWRWFAWWRLVTIMLMMTVMMVMLMTVMTYIAKLCPSMAISGTKGIRAVREGKEEENERICSKIKNKTRHSVSTVPFPLTPCTSNSDQVVHHHTAICFTWRRLSLWCTQLDRRNDGNTQ